VKLPNDNDDFCGNGGSSGSGSSFWQSPVDDGNEDFAWNQFSGDGNDNFFVGGSGGSGSFNYNNNSRQHFLYL